MSDPTEHSGQSESPGGYQAYSFDAHQAIPNHPDWPLLVYRDVFAEWPSDPAEAFERRYRSNDWGGTWRDGIFPYHHYHSTAHEVLGVARGEARVLFGGPGGEEVEVGAGDAAVLPAGTGHKCEDASRDLLVVGGYPPGQNADLRRAEAAPTSDVFGSIQSASAPESDPLFGSEGPLAREW